MAEDISFSSSYNTLLETVTTINGKLYLNADTILKGAISNGNDFVINPTLKSIRTLDISTNDIAASQNAVVNNLIAGTTAFSTSAPLYVTKDLVHICKPLTVKDTLTTESTVSLKNGFTAGVNTTDNLCTIKGTLNVNCINIVTK